MQRVLMPFLLVCVSLGTVGAQERSDASSGATAQAASAAGQDQAPSAQRQEPQDPNAAVGRQLAGEMRADENEENNQFKYSTAVKWFARTLHLDQHQMYWISYVTNFILLILFFYFFFRSNLPQAFRDRTAAIQKGIKEAQMASAEAARRLSEIETRLGKLDGEVAEIRASSERDAAAEEERIRQAAEEDKQKVVDTAEAEIAAIARNARRELKSYAASLAVDLAARKIRVDEPTDHALVREFVAELGKDGK
jgi:F-type H+-transporting ATPase subunit b